ncbi:LPXTG cell wall anchor domain-containing protein [Staphylococcus pettenkoferi]|uniref:LPXTG cell wall anchor domain-containing protein n=1 Tax=Staphylococcus pettenkoferi TaxID=170573 RepID=UPI00227452A9|nr:LPXTG cell wall anchor domain-containing protein [Staphylococcus pettenkoferi]MCY1574541.1 LPXTG cell wall anchor domain-containing protein [Staphylococcus pettenkoferi]MCY1578137.1 LPXTG cell wall anchor domain-containing protein [Staphylococcus pettenkoferi]
MKKLGITSGIVLSGAVLFGGIGTSQAHAESYSSVDASNAENIAKEVAKDNGMDPSKQNFFEPKSSGDYYQVEIGNKSNVGAGAYRVHKDGLVEYRDGGVESNPYHKVGNYHFSDADSNATNDSKNDTKQQQDSTNVQQKQNVTQQNQGNTQQNQANPSNASEQQNAMQFNHNNEQQAQAQNVKQSDQSEAQQAQMLPNTGQSSNSFALGVLAAVLGVSVLAMRRFVRQ